jgi:EAL domain-containing protein (putative c-di-GMP-specific phosphodiesterase class I)/DNA-binding NarL/FixJ family response regulator
VAILDDQEANARLLARFLQRAGFENLVTFQDPREAVHAFADTLPDLLLLDLHMPGLDGFAVLAELRELIAPDDFVPILVLTGDLDRSVRQRALEAGAKDFLLKPFDPDEVVVRCRNLLETRRLHLELRRRNEELAGEVVERTSALEDALRERLAVASALATPRAASDPDSVAGMICRELIGLVGIDGAAIVSFSGGIATPLASAGIVGRRLEAGRHLALDLANRLIERTSTGPWVEEDESKVVAALGESAISGRLWAPMHSGPVVVGALMAASAQPLVGDRLVRMLPTMLEYAAVAGATLAPAIMERQRSDVVRSELIGVIDGRAFKPVFQPIVDLATGTTVGYEALTRFDDGQRPDRRFDEATLVGLGAALELACLAAALVEAHRLPPGPWLSLNISPSVVIETPDLANVLAGADRPLVIELTEHVPVDDYAALRRALRALGTEVRFAIDDAGAGFANFRHIVELDPDFVKLDIGLVRAIDTDPARQALISGMDYFATRTGCALIAEGIETAGERNMLQSLAIPLGQGYLLGRPAAPH